MGKWALCAAAAAGVFAAAGGELETAKWQAAIDAAAAAGGGVVVVPKGDHPTGGLFLKSNVELRLEKGARLVASGNPVDFAPPCAVVAAVGATNVAVSGEGEIFGNGWAYDYSRKDQPKPKGLCFQRCRQLFNVLPRAAHKVADAGERSRLGTACRHHQQKPLLHCNFSLNFLTRGLHSVLHHEDT